MFREMYIFIILFIVFHLNSILCRKSDEENNTLFRIARTLTKFQQDIESYVSNKVWRFEYRRQKVKRGLLKLFADIANDTIPDKFPTRTTMQDNNCTVSYDTQKSLSANRNILRTFKKMTTEDLIKAHGYKPESHYIQTADDYVLTIHRIRPNIMKKPVKGTVILHHGLLGSSEDWLLLDTPLTLPNMLMNIGYDVWLLNARGNKYTSEPYEKLTYKYTIYDNSWHEMGIYDLPATITYITNYTNGTDLHYVGYSMGATTLLVMLSSIPEYNEMLKSAIFLAPLAFMHHSNGPLKVYSMYSNSTYDYMSKRTFPPSIIESFCRETYYLCWNSLLLIANGGNRIWDYDHMQKIFSHVPAEGSAKTIAHYMQLIKSGCFRAFDYGLVYNLEIYNSTSPPNYNLNAITVPIFIISAANDWLSTISDTKTLISKLNSVKTFHVVRRNNFTHLDFIWAKDAPKLVFNIVKNIIEPDSGVNKIDYRDTEPAVEVKNPVNDYENESYE